MCKRGSDLYLLYLFQKVILTFSSHLLGGNHLTFIALNNGFQIFNKTFINVHELNALRIDYCDAGPFRGTLFYI